MYTSPDLLASIIEANPQGRAACREIGRTPADVAYALISDLINVTPAQGDQMIGVFCERHGIFGVHSMRDFSDFVDDLAARYSGETARLEHKPFAPKLSREQQVQAFAEMSKQTPQAWSADSIAHVAKKSASATVTSGVSKKLARSDGEVLPGLGEEYRSDHDDHSHRRALIAKAFNAAECDAEPKAASYTGKTADQASLRELVEFSFDFDSDARDHEEQTRDPDERNRRLSNTLFEID